MPPISKPLTITWVSMFTPPSISTSLTWTKNPSSTCQETSEPPDFILPVNLPAVRGGEVDGGGNRRLHAVISISFYHSPTEGEDRWPSWWQISSDKSSSICLLASARAMGRNRCCGACC